MERRGTGAQVSFGFKSVLFGALTGAGFSVVGQQLGWWAFSLWVLSLLAAGGILAGILLRTIGHHFGHRRARKRRTPRQEAEDAEKAEEVGR